MMTKLELIKALGSNETEINKGLFMRIHSIENTFGEDAILVCGKLRHDRPFWLLFNETIPDTKSGCIPADAIVKIKRVYCFIYFIAD